MSNGEVEENSRRRRGFPRPGAGRDGRNGVAGRRAGCDAFAGTANEQVFQHPRLNRGRAAARRETARLHVPILISNP